MNIAKAKILVADRDMQRRGLIETTLKGACYTVISSGSYEESLKKAIAEKPEVIIVDMSLDHETDPVKAVEGENPYADRISWHPSVVERRWPRAPGYALIGALNDRPETMMVRTILLIPKMADTVMLYGGEGVRADCYLMIPIDPSELLQSVSRLLTQSDAR